MKYIQKQAMIKLAQVRLAINYVLRQRMVKQATTIQQIPPSNVRSPGDEGYDPELGAEYSEKEPSNLGLTFHSYSTDSPPKPFGVRYPTKATAMNLTPSTISNPKVNPFINWNNNNPKLSLKDKIHAQLFGLPTYSTGHSLDEYNGMENYNRFLGNINIPWIYSRMHEERPIRQELYKQMGFPVLEDNNVGNMEFSINEETDRNLPPKWQNYTIDPNLIDFDHVYQDDRGYSVDGVADNLDPNLFPIRVGFPVQGGMMDNIKQLWELKNRFADTEVNDSIRDAYYDKNHFPKKEEDYRKQRNNLMHAYINRSLVGRAFKLHPSMITGVPYALYHALPYLWPENQPKWLRKGIYWATLPQSLLNTTEDYRDYIGYLQRKNNSLRSNNK